jgi:hypothetical protein
LPGKALGRGRWNATPALRGIDEGIADVAPHAARCILTHRPLRSKVPIVCRITRWASSPLDTIIAVDPIVASFIQSHVGKQRIEVVPAFLDLEMTTCWIRRANSRPS